MSLLAPNLLQANVVLGLIVHIENRGDSEPDGLLDGVNIPTKGMNMRIDKSRYNSVSWLAVRSNVFRDGCLS